MRDRYWLVVSLMVVIPLVVVSCGGDEDEGVCGDGVVEAGEECDDGNTDSGDGCSEICTIEIPAGCGDGTLDPGEECDDGNNIDGDGCSASCAIEGQPVCGDGRLSPNAGEQCDDGNNVSGDGCSEDCIVEPPPALDIAAPGGAISASGSIDGTEFQWIRPLESCEPDPANSNYYYYDLISIVNNTGMEQTVTITATWTGGDGFLHAFRDPFDPFDLSGCVTGNDDFSSSDESRIPGIRIQPGEVLHIVASTYSDNDIIGDYTIDIRTAACGDGMVDPGEQCDDGNNVSGDGCTEVCTLEPPMPIEIAAVGGSVTEMGTIDGTDYRWVRPSESCEPDSDDEYYYFDVIAIINNTGANRMLTITADWAGGDGYLHVFMDPFDPADLSSCVIGNDDFNDATQSQITGVDIAVGQVLYIIASTYSENDIIGDYVIDIRTE